MTHVNIFETKTDLELEKRSNYNGTNFLYWNENLRLLCSLYK